MFLARGCRFAHSTEGGQGIANRHLMGQIFGMGVVVEAKWKCCLSHLRKDLQNNGLWNTIWKNLKKANGCTQMTIMCDMCCAERGLWGLSKPDFVMKYQTWTNLIFALSNSYLRSCRVCQSLKLDMLCYVSKPVQPCHLIKNGFQKWRCAEMTAAVEGDKGKEEQSIAASAEMLCSSLLWAFLMALFHMCIHFAVECSKKYGVVFTEYTVYFMSHDISRSM